MQMRKSKWAIVKQNKNSTVITKKPIVPLVTKVKKVLADQLELKHMRYVVNAVAIGFVATPVSIINIPTGTNDNSRNGDQITYHSTWNMKITVRPGAVPVAFQPYRLRYILFQWHPSAAPTSVDLFFNGPSGAIDTYSQYSIDNKAQFTVLYDKVFVIVPGTSRASTDKTKLFTSKQLQKLRKQAHFAGPVTASVGTDMIYQFTIADGLTANEFPKLSLDLMIRYLDG